jgi:sugar phosphate isomerase/epimerase
MPVIGLRIAVQTKCLAQPLKQALHTARRLDVQGVQLDLRHELPAAELSDTAVRQLRKLLDDLDLRVGTAVYPTRRGYAATEDLQRRLEATVQAMHAASRLRVRVLLLTLGASPAPDQRAELTLLEALHSLAAEGDRVGLQLALQAPDWPPAETERLLQQLPVGIVGVDLSPADLIVSGQSVAAYAETLGARVLHVYANDAVRGGAGQAGSDVVLGRGVAEIPELLGILEEHGYQGWVTIERRNSRVPAEDVANAVAFLRAF